MKTITLDKAKSTLHKLVAETVDFHKPIKITGKKKNAILISEEDWGAIEETLYLLSIPGMRESIREGLKTPIDECAEELQW